MAQVQAVKSNSKVAQKPAVNAGQAAVAAKKKRGEGPIAVYFVDSRGNDHVRVPLDVRHIVVSVKGGPNKAYDHKQFHESIAPALLADNFAKRIKQTLANHGDKAGANAITEADKLFNTYVSGKVHSRAAGGKGRPAKVDEELPLYIDAFILLKKFAEEKGYHTPARDGRPPQKIKALTQDEIEELRADMGSMPRAKRRDIIKSWTRQDAFQRIHAGLLAAKLKEKEAKQPKSNDLVMDI